MRAIIRLCCSSKFSPSFNDAGDIEIAVDVQNVDITIGVNRIANNLTEAGVPEPKVKFITGQVYNLVGQEMLLDVVRQHMQLVPE